MVADFFFLLSDFNLCQQGREEKTHSSEFRVKWNDIAVQVNAKQMNIKAERMQVY